VLIIFLVVVVVIEIVLLLVVEVVMVAVVAVVAVVLVVIVVARGVVVVVVTATVENIGQLRRLSSLKTGCDYYFFSRAVGEPTGPTYFGVFRMVSEGKLYGRQTITRYNGMTLF